MAKRKTPKPNAAELRAQEQLQKEYEAANFIEQEFDEEELKSKTEDWINENKTTVLGLGALILLLVAGYFLYNSVYQPGQEASAQADIYVAQQHFADDQFQLALSSSDDTYSGFLDVANSYGGTKLGNLANYYAGVCYLNLGEFENALDYLGRYDGNDLMFSAMAKGCMGDASSELGRMDEAVSYYKKAAAMNPNEFTTPMYLMKAGQLMEKQGNFAGAKEAYESLKKQFPNTSEGNTADKYISRVASLVK